MSSDSSSNRLTNTFKSEIVKRGFPDVVCKLSHEDGIDPVHLNQRERERKKNNNLLN